MSANRPASRKAAWLTKIASAAVTMATYEACPGRAVADREGGDLIGKGRGGIGPYSREVGLGVESERPRVA